MATHGAPGGPTSSALYDAATDAFRRWRAGEDAALDDLVRTMGLEAWRVSKSATRTRPVEDEVLDARMPVQTSPEAEVVTNDENAQLWEALSRLPERCQRLLRIVAWEPRPDYSSVADTLEMPIGSIGPTRRRCLDKLRIELGGLL